MKYLLDTHIWLWLALEPKRLDRKIVRRLDGPDAELWLSPISGWEALSLADKRKIDVGPDPIRWAEQALTDGPVQQAPITVEIVLDARGIIHCHGDPADRMIAATARVLDMVLVTADQALIAAKVAKTLPHS